MQQPIHKFLALIFRQKIPIQAAFRAEFSQTRFTEALPFVSALLVQALDEFLQRGLIASLGAKRLSFAQAALDFSFQFIPMIEVISER